MSKDYGLSRSDPRRHARAFDARRGSLRPASESMGAFLSSMPEDMCKRVAVERHIKRVYEQYALVVDGFLRDHTNSVYLMKSRTVEGAHDLVVYVDNSACAAELNARRELVRLKYREEFGISIDVFEIRISRGAYKDKHPFKDYADPAASERDEPLSEEDARTVEDHLAELPDGPLKESWRKALTAHLKQKNQER